MRACRASRTRGRTAAAVVGGSLAFASLGATPGGAARLDGIEDAHEDLVSVVVTGGLRNLLAARAGVDVPIGTTAAIDETLLLNLLTGGASDVRVEQAQTHDNTSRTVFMLGGSGESGDLTDWNGDGRVELGFGSTALDGATGRTLLRIPEPIMNDLGMVQGRRQVFGVQFDDFNVDRVDCATQDAGVSGLLTCAQYEYDFSYDLVFREADLGTERWRTSLAFGAYERETGVQGSDSLATSSIGVRLGVWQPVMVGNEVRGHVTGLLQGSTTIQNDVTGLGGTASGDGAVDLVAHAPDGSVRAELHLDVSGPSDLHSFDDVTGDGVDDLMLTVMSWPSGTYLCLPTGEQEGVPTLEGCAFPYQNSRLQVFQLDGLTLEVVESWVHPEPVGRLPFTSLLSVGDVTGDGRSDAMVTWDMFQDERWTPDEVRAAQIPSDSAMTVAGSTGGRRWLRQVDRADGTARAHLFSLSGQSGPSVDFRDGILPIYMTPGVPPLTGSVEYGPDRIFVEASSEIVDLPGALSRDVQTRLLELDVAEGEDAPNRALALGTTSRDLDGDGLGDWFVGLGKGHGQDFTAEGEWAGTAGTPIFSYRRDQPVWTVPLGDFDDDGLTDSTDRDFSAFFEVDSDDAPQVLRSGPDGPTIVTLPPYGPDFRAFVWHAGLDDVPGADLRSYGYDDSVANPIVSTCVRNGRTGQVHWCVDGV